MKSLVFPAVLLLAGMATPLAQALENEPASLILFPHFDTRPDNMNVATITNTSNEYVWTRIVWIDKSSG